MSDSKLNFLAEGAVWGPSSSEITIPTPDRGGRAAPFQPMNEAAQDFGSVRANFDNPDPYRPDVLSIPGKINFQPLNGTDNNAG